MSLSGGREETEMGGSRNPKPRAWPMSNRDKLGVGGGEPLPCFCLRVLLDLCPQPVTGLPSAGHCPRSEPWSLPTCSAGPPLGQERRAGAATPGLAWEWGILLELQAVRGRPSGQEGDPFSATSSTHQTTAAAGAGPWLAVTSWSQPSWGTALGGSGSRRSVSTSSRCRAP